MNRQDLEALRAPLIVLALTLLIAGAGVYISGTVHEAAQQRLTAREQELKHSRQRIQKVHEESDLISRYLTHYQALVEKGFVGDEQRMNWLDGLRISNAEARLFGVEYDIGIQRPYSYAAELNVGQLLLQESVMRLRLRLLHEEDLSKFFVALTNKSGGWYTIDQCKLRRATSADTDQSVQSPNLAAECVLRWLTVKPSQAPEKKP